ncbi:hypothetical protein [Microbacterium sp. NPDC056052]|uniref:hypothetical protein n=1 Tax=Microbacterium sp. NPDC056052 TaxID=3345695 RepID=UPI0035DF7485
MTERSRGITVTGAHRTIRTLAEDEGPFEGDLVTRTGGMAVRVDAERLRGWVGWTFAGAEHVAAPLDVALRADGQDVLLPWCVRTVRTSLAQAGEADGISHGEAVTLAASVLRGVLELEDGLPEAGRSRRGDGELRDARMDGEGEPHGSWWLTDEARPVFVIEAREGRHADGPVRDTGERLLRDVEGRIEDRALRRILARLAEALHDPRRLRAEAARWERELLEIAAPRPLRMIADEFAADDREEDPARPVSLRRERPPRRAELRTAGRAGAVASRRTGPRSDHAMPRLPRARAAPRAGALRGGRGRSALEGPMRVLRDVTGHARARGRDLNALRRGVRDRSSWLQSEQPLRRRRWRGPAVVAASAAVAITLVGALWPSDTGGADAAGRRTRTAEVVPSASGSPSAAAPRSAAAERGAAPAGSDERPRAPGASSLSEPAAAGAELIAAARTCEASPQPACAEVWDGGTAASHSLRGAQEPAELIEDYGDIAAIRNGSGEEAQMVVIIRRNAEWRIRDVYDIADPPSEGAGAP